jgi:hypothetical protein
MNETPNPDQSGGAEDDDWGDTFMEGCDKAWKKKVKKDGGEQTFRVDKIHVKGTNPISGYRVFLSDQL